MLRLITGTPGSGKTLFAVSEILKIRENTPERQIFTDIKGLRIEGVEPAPDDWRDAPDGSVIVYDECQYRQEYTKSRGRNNYPMIVDITTHRHTGKDIWLITQNPNFLHPDVLALVGEHYHIDRPLKANFANVYKWRTAQTKPDGVTVRRRAESAPIFKYNKDLFNYYDSVDVDEENAHHKKLELPWFRIAPLLIGFCLCLWAFYAIVFDGGITPPQARDNSDKVAPTTPITPTQNPTNSTVGTILNGQSKEPTQLELTEEQLKEQLKLQQQQFTLELERQRTQMLLDYQAMKMQLIQQREQLKDFERQLELVRTMLPKDHQIIKNNPDLQVRSVVKFGNKCKAYNGQGTLMTINQHECNYYLQETGRVWKAGQTQDNSPTEPRLPPTLTDNSTITQIPVSNSQSNINAIAENSGNLNEQ